MEPWPGNPLARQLRRLLTLLTDRYGEPDRIEGRAKEPASFRAYWLRPAGASGDYRLRLAVEPGPGGQPVVFRLDGESPEWRPMAVRP